MALESLFLFRRIEMVSPFEVDQAKAALQAKLDVGAPREDHEYYRFGGRITGDGFCIMRRGPRSNNVRPLLRGTLRAGPSGTEVRVTARPPLPTAAFCLFFLGMSIYVALPHALAAISDAHYVQLLVLFMPLFAALVAYLPFGLEVGRAERFLRTTLRAERPPSA